MSTSGPSFLLQRATSSLTIRAASSDLQPVTYPYNDTSLSAAERAYLLELSGRAATQNLAENQQAYIQDVSIAFTVLAAFVVGLRFLARWKQGARLLIDDWMILFSLGLLFGNMIFNLVLVANKMGLHSGLLTLEELQYLQKTMIGAEIVYCTSVNVYKLALLLLYFRIFPIRQVRLGGYICGGVSSAWNLACVVAASIQCLPLAKVWEPWRDGWCINLFLTQLCIAVPSTICDLAILCLPIPHVMNLQMTRAQRVLVLGTFLLGGYVVFTSIYRFVVFLGFTQDDMPYTLSGGLAWNVVEVSSGIVGACLPTLGPVVRMLWHGLLPSTIRSRGMSKSGSKPLSGLGMGGMSSSRNRAASDGKPWSRMHGSSSRADAAPGEEAKYGIGAATMHGNDSDEGFEMVVQEPVQVHKKGCEAEVSVQVMSPRDKKHTGLDRRGSRGTHGTRERGGSGSTENIGTAVFGLDDGRYGDEQPLKGIRVRREVEWRIEESR